MPAALKGETAKTRQLRKGFAGLVCVSAEPVLEKHRDAFSALILDVQGEPLPYKCSHFFH